MAAGFKDERHPEGGQGYRIPSEGDFEKTINPFAKAPKVTRDTDSVVLLYQRTFSFCQPDSVAGHAGGGGAAAAAEPQTDIQYTDNHWWALAIAVLQLYMAPVACKVAINKARALAQKHNKLKQFDEYLLHATDKLAQDSTWMTLGGTVFFGNDYPTVIQELQRAKSPSAITFQGNCAEAIRKAVGRRSKDRADATQYLIDSVGHLLAALKQEEMPTDLEPLDIEDLITPDMGAYFLEQAVQFSLESGKSNTEWGELYFNSITNPATKNKVLSYVLARALYNVRYYYRNMNAMQDLLAGLFAPVSPTTQETYYWAKAGDALDPKRFEEMLLAALPGVLEFSEVKEYCSTSSQTGKDLRALFHRSEVPLFEKRNRVSEIYQAASLKGSSVLLTRTHTTSCVLQLLRALHELHPYQKSGEELREQYTPR